MKIKFLGTAAAEGVPAFFCECDTCKRAREKGGKEVRTRSQALINDSVMLDFPADTYMHALNNNLELIKIRNYIITHTHSDHFYPADIEFFGPVYAKIFEEKPIFNFYGGAQMVEKGKARAGSTNGRVKLHEIKPFKAYEIGGLKVTPLKAFHSTDTPFIYIIEDGSKRMLYAHDTGLLPAETEKYLYTEKPHFDLISFDCCMGTMPDGKIYGGHMSLAQNVNIANRMKKEGLIDGSTILVANHFSHNAPNILYENREEYEKHGFVMSYDGLEIEF